MNVAADFRLEETDSGTLAVLSGDWTAVGMGEANERLGEALRGAPNVTLDLTEVRRCDTSGVYGALQAATRGERKPEVLASAGVKRLFDLVEHAIPHIAAPPRRTGGVFELFDRIGHGVVDTGLAFLDTMVFNGHLLVAVGRAIRRPARVRWAPIFALAERAGLDAIPIVSITTFFIGAVVGLIGANLLRQFGAQVFSVELIGVSLLHPSSTF